MTCWGSAERANKTKRETCTTKRAVAVHNNNKTVREGKTRWKTKEENCEGNNGEFCKRKTSVSGLAFVDLSDQVVLSRDEQQLSFSIELSRSVQLICCNPSDFLQHPPPPQQITALISHSELWKWLQSKLIMMLNMQNRTCTHPHPHFHKITNTRIHKVLILPHKTLLANISQCDTRALTFFSLLHFFFSIIWADCLFDKCTSYHPPPSSCLSFPLLFIAFLSLSFFSIICVVLPL